MSDTIRSIGSQMATMMYNLSQGANLPAGTRDLMRDMHQRWDAAVSADKAPPPQPQMVATYRAALQAAAEEFNRISCEGVTETRNVSDALDRAKAFADRGAVAVTAALRASPTDQMVAKDVSSSIAAYEAWIQRNGYKDTTMRRLAFEYGYRAGKTQARAAIERRETEETAISVSKPETTAPLHPLPSGAPLLTKLGEQDNVSPSTGPGFQEFDAIDNASHVVGTDDIAEVLFNQRQTGRAWEDAIEASAESDAGTLVSIVRDDARAVLALFACAEVEG